MPVLTPLELWQQSGRDYIDEIFRLKDRFGRDYVLPVTHEETVTFHARELQSYRQLPQILYHFSIKERDAPRSRGGLIRVREFIMKDSYSFDRDEEGLDRSFRAHEQAYHRIFERCGLEVHAAEAESGMMGGSSSHGLPRARGRRREPARHAASGATMSRTARSRAESRAAPELPERARGAGRDRDARRDDDRGAGGAARDRPGRDLEGDAGCQARRHARAWPRPRRRPPRGREDGRRARLGLPPRDRGGDPRRPSVPTRARSARSASPERSSPTTRFARASSSPARTRPGSTCAVSRPGATTSRASQTSASRRRATPVRSAAGGSRFQTGDRGRTHLQARHATSRSRSARRISTRTARSGRS